MPTERAITGDGEDLWSVAGPTVAAIFAVDDITDIVAGIFDEPMGADDLAQSAGICVGGRETGDVVGTGTWGADLVAALALDADDLGCAREIAEQLLAGKCPCGAKFELGRRLLPRPPFIYSADW